MVVVNNMGNLRTAVIGIGNMGSAHACCIATGEINGLELVAVCDTNIEKLNAFVSKFPEIKAFSDYKEFVRLGIVDCVIIATPHPSHAEIAIYALENGINVMLEKPADISVTKALRLNEVAEKSKKVFGIMFNQRTNPLFRKAREIVGSGELGELKRTVWIVTNWYRTQSYYNSGDWRATWSGEGGGVLLNQAPHNLDIWQWICGMPERITAFCDIGKHHDIEVEDDVTIFTRYKNGASGTFITSTGEYPGTNRLEITGTKGKIVLENGILKHWKLKQDERAVCYSSENGFAKIETEYSEITFEQSKTEHRDILQNFADSILHGTKLIAPGTDGIFELTLSNAAYLSSWKNNCEIKIPFDDLEFDKKLLELSKNKKIKSNTKEQCDFYTYKERWQVRW